MFARTPKLGMKYDGCLGPYSPFAHMLAVLSPRRCVMQFWHHLHGNLVAIADVEVEATEGC
jgi:hypothetical protein